MSVLIPLEKEIEAKVVKWWNSTGYPPSLKLNVMAQRGWPDRLFPTPHAPTFIEFKRPGGQLSPLQAKVIYDLERLGYYVYILDSAEDAIRALAEVLNAFVPGCDAAAAVLEAAPLPKIRSGMAGWKDRGGAIPGSRPGKDFHSIEDGGYIKDRGHNK